MRKDKGYTIGQLINTWLIGALCGVTLYACIRNAEQNEAEYAWRRLTPRIIRTNTLDASACFAPVVNMKEIE